MALELELEAEGNEELGLEAFMAAQSAKDVNVHERHLVFPRNYTITLVHPSLFLFFLVHPVSLIS